MTEGAHADGATNGADSAHGVVAVAGASNVAGVNVIVSPRNDMVTSEAAAVISMIERAARDPAVDIDKLERLMLMREKMQAQTAKTAYLAGFSRLQATLPAAIRSGTGHNNKKYARFEDVIDAIRPHLAAHGFSLSHRVNTENNQIRVTGILGHENGHSESTEMVLPPDTSGNKTSVHAMASSISYAKRYTTVSLTGIATQDDDDGKAAVAGPEVTDEQAIVIRDWLESTSTEQADFLKYFGAESVAKFPAAKFEAAIAAFKKKASKK